MTVEEDFRRLQNALRTSRPEFGSDEAVERMRLMNPVTYVSTLVAFRRGEWDLAHDACEALVNDLRFEYLLKPGAQIEDFVADCLFRPSDASIEVFVTTHAREPVTRFCYLPIESLRVKTPLEVLGITLLPIDDASLPPADLLFSLRTPAASVARVETFGTSQTHMVGRAREEVSHALRVMRVAFRAKNIHERQLRFRISETYAFDDGGAGVHTPPGVAWGLDVDQELANLSARQSIATAPAKPVTDIQRRIDVTIRWMERATFEPDRLLGILYLFFALESLIGEKSGELKAGALSFRQMMLSHIVDRRFTNPITTFDLYQVTRSNAVHGETISEVEDDQYDQFSMVMLRTLEQYLEIANREGFTKRKQLRKFLDEHMDRSLLIKWVKDRGGMPQFKRQFKDLVEYVDSLEESTPGAPSASA